ncbi:MAG: hypothetical protein V1858_02625 [Candidatus Gottesmanbacteria bacterium]
MNSHEVLQTPFGELDKLTGQQFLASHGFPVPEIFTDWEIAEGHINRGEAVVARGRVIGINDNYLINVLSTDDIYSKKGWEKFLKTRRENPFHPYTNDEIGNYCKASGIHPNKLKADFFLQRMIRHANFRVITMDNGQEMVLAQGIHLPRRGYASFGLDFEVTNDYSSYEGVDRECLLKAFNMHQQAKELFNKQGQSYAYQMEFVGRYDVRTSVTTEFYIVQTRIVAPLPHEGLLFLSKTTKEETRKKIGDFGKENIIFADDIRSYWAYSELVKNPPTKPPILVIRINKDRINTFLQHDTYRLFQLVWRMSGTVILDDKSKNSDDLEGILGISSEESKMFREQRIKRACLIV